MLYWSGHIARAAIIQLWRTENPKSPKKPAEPQGVPCPGQVSRSTPPMLAYSSWLEEITEKPRTTTGEKLYLISGMAGGRNIIVKSWEYEPATAWWLCHELRE